jgi:hypothetical protein
MYHKKPPPPTTTTTASTTGTTGFVTAPTGYHLLGCYAEPPIGRALDTVYASDYMTLEMCISHAVGAQYVGVEYGRECWYGATLASGAVLESNDNCKMVCPGNEFQYCGAGMHLIMYQRNV